MTDWIGKRIGKYEINELLGRGGMAEVYKGFHPDLERDVAIKMIHPHLAGEPGFIDRFRREARTVAMLRHPNIVQVHDFDVEDDTCYMVMEFVEGQSLEKRLQALHERGERMPLDEALRLFQLMTESVAYAHAHGVIHRDLKPANVMLTPQGEPILTDFGLSKIIGTQQMSIAGEISGTPAYMAPEQCQEEEGDERSDIYSLGVMLYELTTGTLPFTGDSPIDFMLKHLSDPLPAPRLINPDLPPALERAIQKALEKDPADRFQSAQKVLEALEPVISPVEPFLALPLEEMELPLDDRCPYRGLQVFEEEHAEFYFGREALIGQLVERMQRQLPDKSAGRFLAVLGPSGSGKSSLVRAGLIPVLRAGALPGSGDWIIHLFKPGIRPLNELAAQLAPTLDQEGDLEGTTRHLLDHFSAGGRSLYLAARLALQNAPPEQRVLLVVDQFEEVFTLCSDERQRRRFIENLLYAASVSDGRVVVVLTMRADFYHRCAAYRDLAHRLSERQLLVGPMSRDELRRAIEQPALKVGLWFEPGLVGTILADVAREPGALPLLQHALLELWERHEGRMLTLEDYRASGGVQGAIAQRAEALYARFTLEQQVIVRRVMLRLTQPGEGTEDTRRRVRRDELLPGGERAETVEATVLALTDARLVTTTRDMATGEEQVDVSHEALIRGWPRLREWIDQDRAGLRTHRQLTEASVEWERGARDESYLYRGARLLEAEEWAEEHSADMNPLEGAFLTASREARGQEQRTARRRIQRVIAGLAAGLVVISLLAGMAVVQWRGAESSQATAQAESTRAISAEAVAQVERGTAQAESTRAINAEATADADRATAQAESTRAIIAEVTAEAERAVAQAESTRAINAQATAQAERAIAQTEAAVARSRQLAANALSQMDINHELALLLAIEAGRAADTVEATTVLRESLHLGRTVELLFGHTGAASYAAWNKDGTRIVTSGGDVVRVWDAESGGELAHLAGHSPAWNEDETRILTIISDTVRVWDAERGEELAHLAGHTDRVKRAAWNLDGTRILTASDDGTARVWDAESGVELALLAGHLKEVKDATWSRDGTRIVTISSDTARLWDAESGQELAVFSGHTDNIVQAVWNSAGTRIVTAGWDGTARLWDAESGQELAVLSGHTDDIVQVAWNSAGTRIVTAGRDGTARVWDAESGQELVVFSGHTGKVVQAAWNKDGTRIVTSGGDVVRVWDAESGGELAVLSGFSAAWNEDGTRIVTTSGARARVWDAESGEELAVLSGHDRSIDLAVWNRDGTRILTASRDSTARVWDPEIGAELAVLSSHTDTVWQAAWDTMGKRIVTASADGTARVWDAESGQELALLSGHTNWVLHAAWNEDGTRIVTASTDGTARVWDAESGKELIVLSGPTEEIVWHAAWSPDGTRIATAGSETANFDGLARVWDVSAALALSEAEGLDTGGSGVQVSVFSGHTGELWHVAWNRDGTRILTSGFDGVARVWDAETGQELVTLPCGGTVNHAAWNTDGTRIVTAVAGTPQVWDAESGEELIALSGHDGPVEYAAWSSDGTRIVTAGWDKTARVWDAESGVELFILAGHTSTVDHAAWNEDGTRIVTASKDGTARVWDAESGKGLAVLPGHTDLVRHVAWNRDGTRIVTTSDDGTARVHYVLLADLLETACPRAVRSMSEEEWKRYMGDVPYQETCPGKPVPGRDYSIPERYW